MSSPYRLRERFWFALEVKHLAGYRCQECGATTSLQAHDPSKLHFIPEFGVCLCGECHSKRHPDVPKALFLTPKHWGRLEPREQTKLRRRRGNIRIDKRTGFAYIPKELREEGFTGDITTIAKALTLTLIKPGVPLERAIKSLEIVLRDLQLRVEHEGG